MSQNLVYSFLQMRIKEECKSIKSEVLEKIDNWNGEKISLFLVSVYLKRVICLSTRAGLLSSLLRFLFDVIFLIERFTQSSVSQSVYELHNVPCCTSGWHRSRWRGKSYRLRVKMHFPLKMLTPNGSSPSNNTKQAVPVRGSGCHRGISSTSSSDDPPESYGGPTDGRNPPRPSNLNRFEIWWKRRGRGTDALPGSTRQISFIHLSHQMMMSSNDRLCGEGKCK